jgi:excisionase family DNA binding protein
MAHSFLTSLNEEEFKAYLKNGVKEALQELDSASNLKEHNNILTLEEASKLVNLAKQTLYGLTSKREIPFIKRGKKLYFIRIDLENWLLEGRKLTRKEIEGNPDKVISLFK